MVLTWLRRSSESPLGIRVKLNSPKIPLESLSIVVSSIVVSGESLVQQNGRLGSTVDVRLAAGERVQGQRDATRST